MKRTLAILLLLALPGCAAQPRIIQEGTDGAGRVFASMADRELWKRQQEPRPEPRWRSVQPAYHPAWNWGGVAPARPAWQPPAPQRQQICWNFGTHIQCQ